MLSLIKAEDKVICNSVSILLAPRNTIKMLIIFCRLLDIGVSKLVEAENNAFSVEAENEICYNAGRLWNFMACFA